MPYKFQIIFINKPSIEKLFQTEFSPFCGNMSCKTIISRISAAPKDCGNWLLHELPMAQFEAKKFLEEVLENIQPQNLQYPE